MWTREGCRKQSRAACRPQAWAFIAVIIGGSLLSGCGAADPSLDPDRVESEPPASHPVPTTAADLFPEGPGRSLVLDTCGTCHAVACSAIGQRRPARWDSLKEDHRDKVSNLSEADLETVFGYLKEHFNDSKPEPRVPPHFLEGGCTPF